MKLVFFGSSAYVIPILEVLNKNFNLSLVLTTEENLADAVPAYCIKNKILYLSIRQFNNSTIQQLQKINASVAVLADFGIIIPSEILSLFPKGIINIHPSLLPKYRGPTPVQTAILDGVKTTGVSIMKLDDKIDHGPILGQEKEEILDTDTSETLYKRLFVNGASLLPKVLTSYLEGGLKLIAQNHKETTFTKPLARQDGFIDINNPPSPEKLQSMIRAYFPWPGVFTKLKIKNKELRIKLLPNQKLQVEGKKPVSYKDFFNGYPEAKELIKIIS